MKNLLVLLFTGLLSVGASAASPIDNLAGCFKVSYRFFEDGPHNYTIEGEYYEYIVMKSGITGPLYQHYGQQGDEVIRHWGETWTPQDDGSYKQTVVSPSGKFRYECDGKFVFDQFRCSVANAPKPVRDADRTDYVTLDREITLQITPNGWVQSQNDLKKDANGVAVSNEVGWNEYDRVDEKMCAPSVAFAQTDHN